MGKCFLDFSFWIQGYITTQTAYCALYGPISLLYSTRRWNNQIPQHSAPPQNSRGKKTKLSHLLGPHNNYNTIIFLNINIKVLGQDTNQIAFVVNEAPFVINLGISQYCGVTE